MGQPLVHSQRFGSFIWVSSCLLVSCLCFWLGFAHRGWVVSTCCHGLSFLMNFYLVNIFGFFINTCNGYLGN